MSTYNYIKIHGLRITMYSAEVAASMLISMCGDNDSQVLFLLSLVEDCEQPTQWINCISGIVDELKIQKPKWQVFLVLHSWWRYYDADIKTIAVNDKIYIEFFALKHARNANINPEFKAVTHWSPTNNKFLFLTGVPTRINRVRLLYKLKTAGMIDHCQWSLFPSLDNDFVLTRIHRYLPELSTVELKNFLIEHANNPDNVSVDTSGIGNFLSDGRLQNNCRFDHNDATSYDSKLYSGTDFSLISETYFRDTEQPWITEKTWRAIQNCHPFIIAGDTNSSCYIHRYRFLSFEKYLAFPDYDTISDSEQRLDAVVENVKYWSANIKKHKDDIEKRVMYNKNRFQAFYKEILESIDSFNKKNQIYLDVDKFLQMRTELLHILEQAEIQYPTYLKDKKFCEFYNSVKDESWPDCTKETDFNQLPSHIKEECITVFGYTPVDQ